MKSKETVCLLLAGAVTLGFIGCAGAQDERELLGGWMLEYVDGLPVIDRSPAFVEFSDEGRVVGDASCNRFTGRYELSGTTLALGEVAATRRMCSETLNDQELRVLQVFPRVAAWRIENGLLLLLDADGAEVIRASRREE